MNKFLLFTLFVITGISLHGMVRNDKKLEKRFVGGIFRCDYSDGTPLFFNIAYDKNSYFLEFGGEKDLLTDTRLTAICQMVANKARIIFPWIFSWVKAEGEPFGKLKQISWKDASGAIYQIWAEPVSTKKQSHTSRVISAP